MGSPAEKQGITGSVEPSQLGGYVQWFEGAAEVKAQFIAGRLPPSRDPRLIVDVGSCGGNVAAALAAMLPHDSIEGFDTGQAFVDEARKKYPHIKFFKSDVRSLSYADEAVDVFSSLSVLHEVFSYNGFSHQASVEALREMNRCLRIGGLVIAREPAKPPKPDERLDISFPYAETQRMQPDADILNTSLTSLSQAELMKRLLLEFGPARDYASSMPRDENGRLVYQLPAWLITEFARKRTLVGTPQYWEGELQEQYGVFTAEELSNISQNLGFSATRSTIEYVHEHGFYGELRPEEDIRIFDQQGNAVSQASTLPSHLYAVLVKATLAGP